ncbi:hypothetical protein [Thermotoga sp. KOL6]|uniref:hypothetical protein n=1 Tax=Thermotoga sp. KOL6 TaxID=126741 RepID=UPI000C774210|nr:hypothetical protein [Thermotoga sp. KOL6]PLV59829.1 hypothetical protein AS005_00565 [Thermotoga sp. KOL6]
MKILVGSTVSLEEFERVDLFISWLDIIPSNANFSVVGTEKFFIVGRQGKEWKKGYEFGIADVGLKVFVVGGELSLYPEAFYIAKESGAKLLIGFCDVQNFVDFNFIKAKFWAHTQETEVASIALLNFQGKVHNNIYFPLEKTRNRTGIVAEGVAPVFIEFEENSFSSGDYKNV